MDRINKMSQDEQDQIVYILKNLVNPVPQLDLQSINRLNHNSSINSVQS